MNVPRSFEFIAGSLCLDFVDTVALRKSAPYDLLRSADDLNEWFDLAKIEIQPRGPITYQQLDMARELREAIFRAAKATARQMKINTADAKTINNTVRLAVTHPQLGGDGVVQVSEGGTDALLSLIAVDAVNLFGSALRERIRYCVGCGMYFVDKSRPGKRQWCSSGRRCGNLHKVRRHRARKTRNASHD